LIPKNILKNSIFYSWCFISVIILLAVLSPFIFPRDVLLSFFPVCPSVKYYGVSCIACGLTRSFISISSFHFKEAVSLNVYCLYVYSVFLANEI
jgi:hypothetical protein